MGKGIVVAEAAEQAQLIKAMAAGDQSALARFYDTTCAQVYGLVLHILKDRSLAEEITLDVYLQAWREAGHYSEQRGAPISWLMVIARSRAIDKLRALRKERPPGHNKPSQAISFDLPEEQAAAEEQVRLIRAALEQLEPEPRQVLYLAYFGGMSQSEIAAYLSLPLGTVKTYIRKALLHLRGVLADMDKGGS